MSGLFHLVLVAVSGFSHLDIVASLRRVCVRARVIVRVTKTIEQMAGHSFLKASRGGSAELLQNTVDAVHFFCGSVLPFQEAFPAL